MTAEITILNKNAVALAADSAVTVSLGKEQKVFNTVNKVFRLSLFHPVGVMIYGGASIMNVPWETIIKLYRKNLDKRPFSTLQEYVDDFFSFLISNQINFFPAESQKKYVEKTCFGLMSELIGIINDKIQEEICKNPLSEKQIMEIASNEVELYRGHIGNIKKATSSITASEIKKLYSDIICKVYDDIFQKLKIYKKDTAKIVELVCEYFTKDHYSNAYSGVVFAGFGEEDIYPKMVAYKVEAVVNNKLRFSFDRQSIISAEHSGAINRFAQGDMVSTFLEGIDPNQHQVIFDYIKEFLQIYPKVVLSILDKEITLDSTQKKNVNAQIGAFSLGIFKKFISSMSDYRNEKHVVPVLNMVSLLPKEELAVMAETLVNMTSFKQRVSMSAETVGGPIDVAIITKGDGFIWVKRKPSFDKQINPHL